MKKKKELKERKKWVSVTHFMSLRERFGCMYDDILPCECYLIGFYTCVSVYVCVRATWQTQCVCACNPFLGLFISSGPKSPTILWQTDQQRDGEKKGRWRKIERGGERERKEREGWVSGGTTLNACERGDIKITEFIRERNRFLSLSLSLLDHLFFSSPLSVSHITSVTVGPIISVKCW